MSPEQIPYGVKDFKRIRLENFCYVDKTAFIREMERRASFLFFVRPRRFGKSLLCETLRCYYDVAEKDNFERLFGGLDIGRDPTGRQNSFVVLSLDFSLVEGYHTERWNDKFEAYMNDALLDTLERHREFFAKTGCDVADIKARPDATSKYAALCSAAHAAGCGVYVIVDEYDNFTNDIVASSGRESYREVTHGTGFYRGWFKAFKATCDRIFMTGVSPVTMDDLTSGFNIATNISLEGDFHAMVGFTTEETRRIFEDFCGTGRFAGGVEDHLALVRAWYDSYCFSEDKVGVETLYNCDMVLYYLGALVATGKPPRRLIDGNIRSDWNKLNAILAVQRQAENVGVLPLTEELADHDEVSFNLVDSFPIERIYDEANFKSLYYYYGIVTMSRFVRGDLTFRVPNECVRRQIFDYMREQYASRPNAVDTSEFIEKFNAFAWDGAWREFLTYLAEKYRDNGSVRDGLQGEARINGYMRAYLTIKSVYRVKPELEHPCGFSDYALFPDRNQPPGGVPEQSYVIELKHSKADASDAEVEKKHQEALAQLRAYAADPNLAKLAAGTPVHFICYEFKGRNLVRLEEITPS